MLCTWKSFTVASATPYIEIFCVYYPWNHKLDFYANTTKKLLTSINSWIKVVSHNFNASHNHAHRQNQQNKATDRIEPVTTKKHNALDVEYRKLKR
jgi:hypothetical protein